jgi:phosphohistidine swiveling domain-containing protein
MKNYIFFNTEPNANILGLNSIVNAFWDKRMEKLAGYRLSVFIYELKEGLMNAGVLKAEWEKIARVFLERFINDQAFPDKLRKELEKKGSELYDLCHNTLKKYNHNLLKEGEKKKIIAKIFELYADICVPGLVGPIIEFASGGMTNKIKEILKKSNLAALGLNEAETLVLLVYPNKITWTEKKRDALYALAAKIFGRRESVDNLSKQSIRDINNYLRQWSWLYYGYTGPEYTPENVKEEIRIILDKKINPQEQLKELENDFKRKLVEQKRAMEKLNLAEKEKSLIMAARNFGYTKAYRANLMSLACYTANNFLADFAEKENYSLNQLGACTVREVAAYLKGKRKLPSIDILNRRLKHSLLISKELSERVLIGEAVEKWIKENVEFEKIDKNIKELAGTVACTGKSEKVFGIARIVLSSKDLGKVGERDILISTTTIPDYVPAMRRAGAIVTETGGLTCHAAIVSRELNKPCLIGVKHLLQIFKDGDKVEVDLIKGVIKKV